MGSRIIQGRLILPDRVLEQGQLVIEQGRIQAVIEEGGRYQVTEDLGDVTVAPGFIDVHTHGIAGMDTMDATPATLERMALRYATHGVTGFLPTTMTASVAATRRAIDAVVQAMAAPSRGAQLLGIHLEGPFIAKKFKGAQPEQHIIAPTPELVQELIARAQGTLRLITLAPEVPGAHEAIRLLRGAGVTVSLGHTAASYEQAMRAVELGATHVTHCYNGMSPLHHRDPGLVGAALLCEQLRIELIADGVHLHPEAMRLALRNKRREAVILITDSMAAAELSDGAYALGDQQVQVRDGQARLRDGTLAGSTLTIDAAVRNIVRLCKVPLHDAVYMASASPAAVLGLEHRKGALQAGYDADLALLDRDLQPYGVMIGGEIIEVLGMPALDAVG